ncbi:MAG: hypothetical protein Q8891_13180 [Bacteroidota bacterium]|nr:hypothetical protein [Bacteroidota bacterium]
MAIVEENSIGLGSHVEQSLRDIISKWADNIPSHPYENFGNTIRIGSITYSPIYVLDCKTQFYSMDDSRKERPYGNGPTYINGASSSRKKYERSSFVKHVERYCLPGSEEVHTCSTCDGSGKNSCNNCSGRGAVNCSNCGGTGNCNSCHSSGKIRCSSCNGGRKPCGTCGGTGGHNEYNSITKQNVWKVCNSCGGSRTQICSVCSGSGKINCYQCFGSGRCNVCNGRRTVTCNTCHGSGKITCKKCNGDGKTIFYTERVEKWDYSNMYNYVLSPSMKNDFQNYPVKKNASTEFISEKLAERLNADLYASEPQHFQSVYKSLLNAASVPSSLDVQPGASILEQYTSVKKIPAYYIKYDFEESNYGLVVFPMDEEVFEEDGPLTRFRKELIENSHKHLKRRNYGKSAELAEQAVKMGLDTRDELLEKIHKKVTIKIKVGYKIGAFAGAWITAYFVFIYVMSHFITPTYFLPSLNQLVQDWGGDFIMTNNLMIALLIAMVSIVQSVKIAGKKMVPFPGRQLKPEAMRFAAGAVTGIFYTLFITLVILLLNDTGILLIATKAMYALIKIVLPGFHADSIINFLR